MNSILRPLLPLLLLVPLMAAGSARAAVPAPSIAALVAQPLRLPPPVRSSGEIVRAERASVARLFTVSALSCVRTGNRMVC
ncbi:hypothetical protein Q4F19_05955 [Sphingomonas sp. BIUV-7]|uniref:Uncharacterized protein n=1 Tax=Sphingomonas natans TaxID=3063330 RepID=A0ABT8Y6G6_9SPHN|nr:hypothetical protein [Sphingomonas sp. BIUV-7]MDO6413919.1 hypothetical protein [Sphingomonas sp. BIUV-7]